MTLVSYLRDKRGTIAIMSAAAFTIACGLAALAIDVGSVYLQRREAQGAADLAAIAAANNLDDAYGAAQATLLSNGMETIEQLVVETGRYEPDVTVPAGLRFTAGLTPTNAVRVAVASPAALSFAAAFMHHKPTISVEATAATASLASFSLGSRLLAVRGGLANQVLGALLGTNIELTAMDYDSLAATRINVFKGLDALATQMDLQAGTYDDVLQGDIQAGDFLESTAEAASSTGDSDAARILSALAGRVTGGGHFTAASIIDAGPLAGLNVGDPAASGFDASLSALEMLQAAAVLAGGGRQLSLDLTGQVPGFLTLTAELTVGEPMQHSGWVSVGQREAELHTAQTRLRLTGEVGGTGHLNGIRLRIPLYAEAASASAKLSEVQCADPDDATVTVEAEPGVAMLAIGRIDGDLDDLPARPEVRPATLVSAPLLRATGKASIDISNMSADALVFKQSEIGDGTVKRAGTHDALQSAIASLLGRLELNLEGPGLRLPTGRLLSDALARQLATIATPLDAVLQGVFDALGVSLGEADVRVDGVNCRPGVLTG
ncbi:MAG: TadG family pilus assembly protein [Hyphomicrobiaceae bacterium]